MYNTKFPTWEVATAQEGSYNGQLAYAYAKRGQVLLCERWASLYPTLPFVSCHPGWTDTAGIQAAYGDMTSYFEPLRSNWEGSEGIAWLTAVPNAKDTLESGAYYLDRSPCRKHLGGLFMTEGSYTKNTSADVDNMMMKLKQWSDSSTRDV